MKIALLMNQHAYVGREYLAHLNSAGINVDVVNIGSYPKNNDLEGDRCGHLWQPLDIAILSEGLSSYSFSSLNDPAFITHLAKTKYDIGIQGGTGILKAPVIDKFKFGILNFHPGDIPKYRGCCAPEWQILEGNPVKSTCHIVDEGIDSGLIYKVKTLSLDYSNYHTMRATIYRETGKFMTDVIAEIVSNKGFISELIKQNEDEAIYRSIIDESDIKLINEILQNKRDK